MPAQAQLKHEVRDEIGGRRSIDRRAKAMFLGTPLRQEIRRQELRGISPSKYALAKPEIQPEQGLPKSGETAAAKVLDQPKKPLAIAKERTAAAGPITE